MKATAELAGALEVLLKLVRIASFTSVIGFLGVTCTYAADRHSRDKGEAVREKQEKADIKNFETFVKMNAFSQEKYGADANFRDDVDDAYSDLLRQHTEMAYERNISRSSRMWAVQEDRFRLHTGLYDHPLLQEQINRIGQSLVPADPNSAANQAVGKGGTTTISATGTKRMSDSPAGGASNKAISNVKQ